jgi:hypothetical protein
MFACFIAMPMAGLAVRDLRQEKQSFPAGTIPCPINAISGFKLRQLVANANQISYRIV